MMRKIKIILMAITITMVIPTMAQSQMEEGIKKWERVINAIAMTESGGNPNAHNPNGDCCGLLQITKILVKECNLILEKEKSKKRYTLQDRYDATKSKEMFVIMQEHFNPEMNIEKAIKCWNCGFYGNGWKYKSKTYYKKVMKYY